MTAPIDHNHFNLGEILPLPVYPMALTVICEWTHYTLRLPQEYESVLVANSQLLIVASNFEGRSWRYLLDLYPFDLFPYWAPFPLPLGHQRI